VFLTSAPADHQEPSGASHRTVAGPSSGPWLFSARADFWGAAAGGGVLLAALTLILAWRGDRELSVADIVLGELHLGATYDAIVRRRLWVRMPVDVLVMPLAIVAATYLLILNDHALLVTTTVLYLGAWHRGRQAFGIARHYQRRAGGPMSPAHRWLLSAAFYLPMIAAVAYYTSTAPDHEGEPFHQLALGPDVLWALAGLAGVGVLAYLALTIGRVAVPGREPSGTVGATQAGIHPGERWLVLANALGFGSAYVLGAWNSWFVIVLAIHHEVQYLFFTYAVARRTQGSGRGAIAEIRRLARFAVWPVVGLASWAACTMTGIAGLEPFLIAGLLGHYWLDGRIWDARARRLATDNHLAV
jgi:hypothetical protein